MKKRNDSKLDKGTKTKVDKIAREIRKEVYSEIVKEMRDDDPYVMRRWCRRIGKKLLMGESLHHTDTDLLGYALMLIGDGKEDVFGTKLKKGKKPDTWLTEQRNIGIALEVEHRYQEYGNQAAATLEIAEETGLATGTISDICKDWKRKHRKRGKIKK